MLPESFWGRIIYLLQQYGPSFAKGAGVSMWLALVGTLFGCIIAAMWSSSVEESFQSIRDRQKGKSNRYDTCTDHDQCHSSAGTSKYYATDRQ